MDFINFLGYFFAILAGVTMGLLGGGGSILTVPIMVYLLHVDPIMATTYSLFVTGINSMVGALAYMQKKSVEYRIALTLAFPAFVVTFLSRYFILPRIPEIVLHYGEYLFTRRDLIMLLFAVLMLNAAFSMIRNRSREEQCPPQPVNYRRIFIRGIFLGFVTGLIGAGGGFLIIPILVLDGKLSIKKAVGSSLLIIAINSLVGFMGSVGNEAINWAFLAMFSGLAIAGVLAGSYLSAFIASARLKPAFGWLTLVMGLYVFVREIVF